MAPRYKITLTRQERENLEDQTRNRKTTAVKFVHGRALLLCDAGPHGDPWKVADVAAALGITPRTVEHLKQRFVEEGIESALERRARTTPPAVTFGGEFDARLTALACSPALDARRPVVCMDESNKQLVGEVQAPIAAAPGHPRLVDHEYVRNGVAEIFVEIEPLAGRRHIEVTEQRTRQDWARFIQGLLEERYPEADQVVLVMDNLNTHAITSLYETFPPAQARRLAERLDIHYTPKHGSWLNIAEIELSALNSQCLDRRIPNLKSMRHEVAAWEAARNNRGAPVNWRFTTADARIKLARLYPKL